MKIKTILNGCASNVKAQAEALNGFMDRFLRQGADEFSTILFHTSSENKDTLLGLVPTGRVDLVRIDRYQPETILAALEHIEEREDNRLEIIGNPKSR